jgi:hypothetical protein
MLQLNLMLLVDWHLLKMLVLVTFCYFVPNLTWIVVVRFWMLFCFYVLVWFVWWFFFVFMFVVVDFVCALGILNASVLCIFRSFHLAIQTIVCQLWSEQLSGGRKNWSCNSTQHTNTQLSTPKHETKHAKKCT